MVLFYVQIFCLKMEESEFIRQIGNENASKKSIGSLDCLFQSAMIWCF